MKTEDSFFKKQIMAYKKQYFRTWMIILIIVIVILIWGYLKK